MPSKQTRPTANCYNKMAFEALSQDESEIVLQRLEIELGPLLPVKGRVAFGSNQVRKTLDQNVQLMITSNSPDVLLNDIYQNAIRYSVPVCRLNVSAQELGKALGFKCLSVMSFIPTSDQESNAAIQNLVDFLIPKQSNKTK